MKKLILLSSLILFVAPRAYAQQGAPNSADCATIGSQPAINTTDKASSVFLFCGDNPAGHAWILSDNGAKLNVEFQAQDTPNTTSGLYQFYSKTPVTLAPGKHSLVLSLIRLDNPGVTVVSSAPIVVNSASTVPVDQCAPPLGTDSISIFVTRYLVSGTQTDVSFIIASKSPVSSVSVLVDGLVVKTKKVPGIDLKEFSGLWIPTPSSGRHDLAVSATNEVGCTSVVPAAVKLQVK